MIEYPRELSTSGRATVERALAQSAIENSSPLFTVLNAFEKFVFELTNVVIRQQDQWTAERLRSVTEAFLDQLIEHVYVHSPTVRTWRSSDVPGGATYVDLRQVRGENLIGFAAAVHEELRKCPFWTNFQQNILILADAESPDQKIDSEIVPTSTSVTPDERVPDSDALSDRAASVDAFLESCNEVPGVSTRILKSHIWRAAKHKQARQFERWQARSPQATASDEKTFGRLLAMTPTAFVNLLTERKIL